MACIELSVLEESADGRPVLKKEVMRVTRLCAVIDAVCLRCVHLGYTNH